MNECLMINLSAWAADAIATAGMHILFIALRYNKLIYTDRKVLSRLGIVWKPKNINLPCLMDEALKHYHR